MKGVIKSKVGLKAKLGKSNGGKSDHYITTANHFSKFIKTESRITKIVYEESEETE